MLACWKVLENAGDKGFLKTRALEDLKVKKTKSCEYKRLNAAKAASKKAKATGISMPNFVNGQPVVAGVGVQQLQEIADEMAETQAANAAKRPHVCPFAKCCMRYTTIPRMITHFNIKHKGFDITSFMSLPATTLACSSNTTGVAKKRARVKDGVEALESSVASDQ